MRSHLYIIAALIAALFFMSPQGGYAQDEEKTEVKIDAVSSEDKKADKKEPEAKQSDTKKPEAKQAVAPAPAKDDKEPEKTEASKEPETPPTFKINIADLESIGLWEKNDSGFLGRDLWTKSPRSALIALIENAPEGSTSSIINQFVYGTLLSDANARLIKNDSNIDTESGADLFTLRLERLLALGAYDKAFKLYSQLDAKPYHIRLAKAGIISMLNSGNKGLACIDIKTNNERFKGLEGLSELSLYCDMGGEGNAANKAQASLKTSSIRILRTLAKDKNYSRSYSANSFEKMDPLERAILVAEDRIDYTPLKTIGYSKLPANHIMAILASKSLSDTQRLILNAKAASYGLVTYEEIEELYQGIDSPALAAAKGWIRLPAHYKAVKKATPAERSAALKGILKLERQYGLHALMPFASFFTQDYDLKDHSPRDIHTILSLRHLANLKIPAKWIKSFPDVKKVSAPKAKKLLISSYLALYAATPQFQRNDTFLEKYENIIKDQNSALFIDFIDKDESKKSSKNTEKDIYDKRIFLTGDSDYVMPNVHAWNRFRQSSENGAIAETVLLSTIILRSVKPKDNTNANWSTLYSGLLRDLVQGLDAVGLKEKSRDLAISVALEQQ